LWKLSLIAKDGLGGVVFASTQVVKERFVVNGSDPSVLDVVEKQIPQFVEKNRNSSRK
jgi:hypothetical protein